MQKGIVEFLLQNSGSLFLLILSGTIGYCFYFLAQELQHQKPLSSRRHGSPRTAVPGQNRSRIAQKSARPAHPLQGKLVKLLNGDQKAAARLIANSQAKFPDKPTQWHYEKAIYDLSRDRH